VSADPAAELLPVPALGRRFSAGRSVRLGDVDPVGRLRLDAVARYLQDVATDDARDAELPNAMGWMVRRTMIRVEREGSFGEELRLTTFCTGHGRSWAERRTSVEGGEGASIEAVSLWVQIDPERGRPARLDEEFFDRYGEAAGGRAVSSRLQLPTAPADRSPTRAWTFRRADLDPFDHVNNAAAWTVLEEVLQGRGADRVGVGEVEYAAAVDAGVDLDLVVDERDDGSLGLWLGADGRVAVAIRWRPRSADV
jgi:acyl-ACP thioesterase